MPDHIRKLPVGDAELTIINIGDVHEDLNQWWKLPPAERAAYGTLFTQPARLPIQSIHIAVPGASILVDAGAYDYPPDSPLLIPGYTPPPELLTSLHEAGIGFLYAPLLHTAMKHVMAARREMGVRTVFNMLGPLTNPAGANVQLIGVYAPELTEPLARVLAELGTIRAFVVHGADGLDEISTTGDSWAAEVREGVVRTITIRPEDFGVSRAMITDLRGGDREENAEIIRRILAGEPGPRRGPRGRRHPPRHQARQCPLLRVRSGRDLQGRRLRRRPACGRQRHVWSFALRHARVRGPGARDGRAARDRTVDRRLRVRRRRVLLADG